MFRLTREVRFGIGLDGHSLQTAFPNGFGGYPPLPGLAHYLALRATLQSPIVDPASNYLINIVEIDRVVRESAIPELAAAIHERQFRGGGRLIRKLYDALAQAWPAPARLHELSLSLSPFLSVSINAQEHPMARLSHRFEFSASHRLYNPELSEEQNLATYGKCSNPHGHGHNYELQVTVAGEPDATGVIIEVPRLERIVMQTVIERLDHRNLNVEVPQFAKMIPSVENIARVIYGLLAPEFAQTKAKLASVTVWETPKTCCEYSE